MYCLVWLKNLVFPFILLRYLLGVPKYVGFFFLGDYCVLIILELAVNLP